MKSLLRAAALWGGGAVAIFAPISLYSNVANVLLCDCLAPLRPAQPLMDKFRTCTDLSQTIHLEESINIKSTPADVNGWEHFVPSDTSLPARLVVQLRKDRDAAVFYPRLSGEGSRITVYAQDGPGLRRLLSLDGLQSEWSSISAQYLIDLRCVRYGYLKEEFETKLIIELKGPFTQIWHKNGSIFF